MIPKLPRYLRLLPGVVVVSGALIVLKASGLVHDAYALAETASASAFSDAPVAVNRDFAGGDDEIASAAQADILTSLSRRRGELDGREAQIRIQSDMLQATEQRVDAKIAQLKTLQDQISKLLVQRDETQKAQIASLVKTYSVMKSKDAARIFGTLSDDVLVPVAQQMKSDILAPVLAAMPPDAAQKLTIKLANRLTLPSTADALAPVPAAPQQQSQAETPVQTANATPTSAAPASATPTSATPAGATSATPAAVTPPAPAPVVRKPKVAKAAPAPVTPPVSAPVKQSQAAPPVQTANAAPIPAPVTAAPPAAAPAPAPATGTPATKP